RTYVGRHIYAVGGNERSAYLSGISVNRIKYTVYILSGFICACAGLLFSIRIRAVIPDAGLNSPLEVVTAVVIGGTAITGGKGTIAGSLLGVLALFLLTNGFSLLNLNPFWQLVVLGLLLIYVVGREGISKALMGKRQKKKSHQTADIK
ncbi:MAG: ABC transporter permease, partial [Candidatus Atribacteria bacterium]|nr:ABC transporter permease [Candidatus Atribacteria bacterium]